MTDQSQRIVLITGGSSGIGFEMAKQMSAQRSVVIICGRSQEKLENAKRQVPQLFTIQCDITKPEDRSALLKQISANFRGLNMLVNNAGISMRYLLTKTGNLEERIVTEWQTNFLAPVLLAQQFLPLLIENKGALVNVTSGLAYTPLSIEPSYCASKAALHSMTQSMRVQFSNAGVKVVEVFYPAVDTPFQGGHAPENAMKPGPAAEIALRELNRGKQEIHVGMAGMLLLLNRLMPERALRLVNGFIPANVEELLAGQEKGRL
jgi:uncharacterized oxidoreductase